jgi:hypothetical protein
MQVSLAVLDQANANHADPFVLLNGTAFDVFRDKCTPHLVLNELARRICPPGRYKRPRDVPSQHVTLNNIIDGLPTERLGDWQWEQCLYLVQFLAATMSEAIHRIV